MRNVLVKSCRENNYTHFMFRSSFFENSTVYNIEKFYGVWKAKNFITKWRMRVAC
jgi:hypothetical protein